MSRELMSRRLQDVEQSNGDERRLGNLNTLNALCVRLDSWMSILKDRQRGPSGMELAMILDDLNDAALMELRQCASRLTSYEND